MAERSAGTPIIPTQGDASTGLDPSLVFVYGSLKRNQPNHHWLAGATWLGEASLNGVPLFDLGPFPMAVAISPVPEGCRPLQGELYQVDGASLHQLDRLEGTPRLFQRHWLTLSDGRSAWVYLGRAAQVRHVLPIPTGHWTGPRLARWRRPEAMA